MTRHIHADHIIAAANDTTIQWEFAHLRNPALFLDIIGAPSWDPECIYRQKPKTKKTVDLYLWAYKTSDGMWFAASRYMPDEATTRKYFKLGELNQIRLLDYTKLTVEVDE